VVSRYGHFPEKRHIYDKTTDLFRKKHDVEMDDHRRFKQDEQVYINFNLFHGIKGLSKIYIANASNMCKLFCRDD
jgi:hypothetical protein